MGRSLVRAAEAVRVEARAAVESMEATEPVVDQAGAGMAAATVVTTEKAKVEAMQAAAASAAPLEEAGVTVAVKAVAAEAKARVAKVLVVLEGAVRPAAAAIQAAFRPVPTFRHHQPCMQRSMPWRYAAHSIGVGNEKCA